MERERASRPPARPRRVRVPAKQVLVRKGDQKDRRVKRVYLTPKAEEQMTELKAIRDEIVEAIYHGANEDEIVIVKRVLAEVRRNLLDKVK